MKITDVRLGMRYFDALRGDVTTQVVTEIAFTNDSMYSGLRNFSSTINGMTLRQFTERRTTEWAYRAVKDSTLKYLCDPDTKLQEHLKLLEWGRELAWREWQLRDAWEKLLATEKPIDHPSVGVVTYKVRHKGNWCQVRAAPLRQAYTKNYQTYLRQVGDYEVMQTWNDPQHFFTSEEAARAYVTKHLRENFPVSVQQSKIVVEHWEGDDQFVLDEPA